MEQDASIKTVPLEKLQKQGIKLIGKQQKLSYRFSISAGAVNIFI